MKLLEMGIDKNRFITEVDEEFICPICKEVFEDPVHGQCEHDFCRKCLENRLEKEESCPIDGTKILKCDLKTNNFLVKLLGKQKVTCEFASLGCDQVITLSSMSSHISECLHNPDLIQVCNNDCEMELTKQEVKSQCCLETMRSLKEEIKQLDENRCQMEKEMKSDIKEQNTKIDESRLLINKLEETIGLFAAVIEDNQATIKGLKEKYKMVKESQLCMETLENKIDKLENEFRKIQLEKEEVKAELLTQKLIINENRSIISNFNENENNSYEEIYGRLMLVLQEKESKIDELEKTMNERISELERKQTAQIQEENYKMWLWKFSESPNQKHRLWVEKLKQKKLITDLKTEAVLMRLEASEDSLPTQYTIYFNWLVPTVMSTLKDNLQLASTCLIHGWWGYLTYCFALMVGSSGKIYTNFKPEMFSEKQVGIKFEGEGIFHRIEFDIEKIKLMQYGNELFGLKFDCMISGIDTAIEEFIDQLKPGGKIIKFDPNNYSSFGLMEKMMDGTVEQSEVNQM